ncbi:hypothetical protein M427DRAFT_122393, partial [Gonapodya prolifera JEL478]
MHRRCLCTRTRLRIVSQTRCYAKPGGDSPWPGFTVSRPSRQNNVGQHTPQKPSRQDLESPPQSQKPKCRSTPSESPSTASPPLTPTPVPFGQLYQPASASFRTPFLDEILPQRPEWASVYATVAQQRFPKQVVEQLLRSWGDYDLSVREDTGWVYLREDRYESLLNSVFGYEGWLILPSGPPTLTSTIVSQPFALLCRQQFVATARGSFIPPIGTHVPPNPGTDPSVQRAMRYEALARCCKDLGVASELWDPAWVNNWRDRNCIKLWVNFDHQVQMSTGKRGRYV